MGVLQALSPIAMVMGGNKKRAPEAAKPVSPAVDQAAANKEITDAEYRMISGRKRTNFESSLLPNSSNILGG